MDICNLAIIIVTHNSEFVLKKNIESILKLHINYKQLIIIDSGSEDKTYLKRYELLKNTFVIYENNVGFAKGNNIGYSYLKEDINMVLFLNPDIIFSKNIIPNLIALIKKDVLGVSPILKRYIIKSNKMIEFTEDIDSSGIYSTWYGKYYDSNILKNRISYPEALCGAYILCDRKKLDKIIKNGKVFNENMFMYKEDIELGLRIRSAGYQLIVDNNSIVYHGRGWKSRSQVLRWQRLISAKNDWYLLPYIKGKKKLIAIIFYLIKYFYVKYIE